MNAPLPLAKGLRQRQIAVAMQRPVVFSHFISIPKPLTVSVIEYNYMNNNVTDHYSAGNLCSSMTKSYLCWTEMWLPYWTSWGQHGSHLGPVGPRWAPCFPHETCYQGWYINTQSADQLPVSSDTSQYAKGSYKSHWFLSKWLLLYHLVYNLIKCEFNSKIIDDNRISTMFSN